jgi:anti-sigma factor RsiW
MAAPGSSCPDDGTYAQLLEGVLPPQRAADLERHLDSCQACTDLVAQLGKIYGPTRPSGLPRPPAGPVTPPAGSVATVAGGAEPVEPRVVGSAGTARLGQLELGMALAHGLWGVLCLFVLAGVLVGDGSPAATEVVGSGTRPGLWAVVAAWYAMFWAPFGAVVAAGCAFGLARHRRWARPLAGVHAVVSLPSVVLVPLAVVVLFELFRSGSSSAASGPTPVPLRGR